MWVARVPDATRVSKLQGQVQVAPHVGGASARLHQYTLWYSDLRSHPMWVARVPDTICSQGIKGRRAVAPHVGGASAR